MPSLTPKDRTAGTDFPTLSHERVCQVQEAFQDHLHEVLDDCSGKWSFIADEIGLDVSLLSHWTSNRGRPMPAWRLIDFTRVCGPRSLRWVCRQCGYDLVPLETTKKASPGRLAS